MLVLFFVIVLAVLIAGRNLLSVLLLLELLGFVVIYFIGNELAGLVTLDFLVMIIFCVLVMEGVVSLCGLILLVSFSGGDYVNSSVFLSI